MKRESKLTDELLRIAGLTEEQVTRLKGRPIPFAPSPHGSSCIIVDNDGKWVTQQVPWDKAGEIAEALSNRVFELNSEAPAENAGMRPAWARQFPEHSDLREWLQSISPLPWHTGGRPSSAGFVYSGQSMVFAAPTVEESQVGVAAHPLSAEAKANAEYTTHCANVLPRLLKAVEAFESSMHDFFQGQELPDGMLGEWNTLHDAIAEAHGGNVAARLTSEDLPTTQNASLLPMLERCLDAVEYYHEREGAPNLLADLRYTIQKIKEAQG